MPDDPRMFTVPRIAAQVVADYLEGHGDRSIVGGLEAYGLPEEFEDDQDFLQELDDRVFLCGGCGWWCSNDELNNDDDKPGVCDECAEA